MSSASGCKCAWQTRSNKQLTVLPAQRLSDSKSWHMVSVTCNVAEPVIATGNSSHIQGIDSIKAQQNQTYLAMMVVYVTATASITPEMPRNTMEVRVPGPVLPSITSAMV